MDDVILRPVEEADLDVLCRTVTDPEAFGEFEWTGFRDPKALRRRWEEDSWLGATDGRLVVALAGDFAGDVAYKDRSPVGCQAAIFEIGIALLPQHRGHGMGTTAQRLLVQHMFATTPAHRLEAWTDVDNIAEQRSLEKVGFEREGVRRQMLFRAGRWRDCVLYGLLR